MKTASILSSGHGDTAMITMNGNDLGNDPRVALLLGHPAGYEAQRFNAAGLPIITNARTPIGKTGWTYGDAVEEVIASGGDVDLELFPFAAYMLAFSEPIVLSDGRKVFSAEEEQFEQETGWSMADAIDMAAEAQRDRRLFGRRH